MKLILLVTAVALSASAYAQVQIVAGSQTEVAPSYTTEPVTYQAAHCPLGYQLQRWEEHYNGAFVNTNVAYTTYRPSGYYPVSNVTTADASSTPHPDKCVRTYGSQEPERPAAWNGTGVVTLPGLADLAATIIEPWTPPITGQTTYGIWIGDGTGSTSGQIHLRYGETTYPVSFPQPSTSFKGDLWIRQSGRTLHIPIDENTTLEFIPSK